MQPPSRKARRTSTQKRYDSLQDLIYSGTVTQKGLEQILRRVRNDPTILERGAPQKIVSRALQSAFEEVRHVHQVPLEEDSFTWEWEFCDPSRLIRHLVSECPRLHNAFVQTALTHPTPWNIVVAFDEFDVGDLTNH